MPTTETQRIPGGEQLREWVFRERVKVGELARRVGASHSHLSNIISGRDKPGRELALAIERETGVGVAAWADAERGAA